MEMNAIKAVYFVGIGGIGMSAIARYFLQKGLCVGGYDRTPSELTRKLQEEGARIHYEEDVEQIPSACRDKDTCLVVYTPAIPGEHAELAYFKANGFEIEKRAQVLGTLTRAHKGLCVAGTHGKTTTSSMAAHILHQSHVDCNAFLGGITKNYGTNYILSPKSDYVVIEADEFDRSFHWLTPYASVITATDPDHLDIYGTKEAYLESFRKYTSLIRPGGFLDVQLGVPVSINIENGIAAMALAQISGVTPEEIKRGMASFRGVDRRFDFRLKDDKAVFLTDYAHHPAEIRQSVISIRELYRGKKIAAIFQPHLYTRTRDFYKEFAESLSLLDEVILTDIYPARETPIPGVTSRLIYDRLAPTVKKCLCRKEDVPEIVRQSDADVFILLGAGDLESYAPQITEILKER